MAGRLAVLVLLLDGVVVRGAETPSRRPGQQCLYVLRQQLLYARLGVLLALLMDAAARTKQTLVVVHSALIRRAFAASPQSVYLRQRRECLLAHWIPELLHRLVLGAHRLQLRRFDFNLQMMLALFAHAIIIIQQLRPAHSEQAESYRHFDN